MVRTYGLTADDYSVLCYLPLCHVGERICSMTVHLCTGGTVNFAESIDTIDTNIREIGPTFFLGMPRVWEKHRLNALIRLNEARPYQKWLFEVLFERIRARLDIRLKAGRPPRLTRALRKGPERSWRTGSCFVRSRSTWGSIIRSCASAAARRSRRRRYCSSPCWAAGLPGLRADRERRHHLPAA